MTTPTKPEEARTLRPGWKTTEFWLSLFGALYPLFERDVPAAAKVIVSGAVAVGYAVARGVAKRSIGQ